MSTRPSPRTTRTASTATATAATLALALAACGGGGSSGSASPSVAAPTARAATAAVDDVNGAKASPQCAAKVKTLRVTTVGTLNSVVTSGKTFMEKAHPGLKVQLSSSASNYSTLVNQVSADKAAGRSTDLAVAGFDLLPVFVRSLGAQEVSPRLLRASYDQRFVPLGKVGGKQYGIPQQVSVPVLMYDKAMLAKAGVDPSTLGDTAGLLAVADKIKKALPGVTAVDLPTGQQFAYWFLNTMAGSKGTNLQDASGQPAYNTPAALEAMNVMRQVASYGPQSNDPTVQGLISFGLKKSAIVGATSAAVAGVKGAVAGRGKDAFDIGTVPFPTLPGGSVRPVAGGNALVVLTADACQKEMATEMLVALLTPDVIAASTAAVSYLSVDKTASRQLAPLYAKYPDLAALNDLAARIVPPPSWGGARGGELPQTTTDVVVGVEKGGDPAKALSDLQSKAAELTR